MRISDWSSDVCSSDLLMEPHYPKPGNGRRPYPLETMLRIHFMQLWFSLSDPAMEEALYDSFSMRQFARLGDGRVPDETTILNFRHLLEKHGIAEEALEAVNLLLQDQGIQEIGRASCRERVCQYV